MSLTLDNVDKGFFKAYDTERMLRLHNPWGKKEWNGAWSDGSSEWNQVADEQKRLLGITIEDDGEFWMTWRDFLVWFTDISMCHQKQSSWFSGSSFYENSFFGSWTAAKRPGDMMTDLAGGCHNNRATFLCNPQFRFDVPTDCSSADSNKQVMISLTQKDFWQNAQNAETSDKIEGKVVEDREARLLIIGLHVLKVEDNRIYRLHRETTTAVVSRYAQQRSAFVALRKPARGRYVVLPTTFEPLHQAEFMLRIAAPFDTKSKELTEHKPTINILASCCAKKYVCVTKITIAGARDLADSKKNKDVDPYCIVNCEGVTERTHSIKETNCPQWKCEYIFYRKDPLRNIEVDIWDNKFGFDSSLGRATVHAPIDNLAKSQTIKLFEKKSGKEYGAVLDVTLATYDDLLCL